MKNSLLVAFTLLILGQIANANTTVRYVGQSDVDYETSLGNLKNRGTIPCTIDLTSTPTSFEVTAWYQRKELRFLDGQKIIFDKSLMTPASKADPDYYPPGQGTSNSYYNASNFKVGNGYMILTFIKDAADFDLTQVEYGWNDESTGLRPAHCLFLKKQNSF